MGAAGTTEPVLADSSKLGVVIVSFNSASFIAECLASLFASSGVELAVVVVDNASTDGTPEAIRQFVGGHRRNEPSQSPVPLPKAMKIIRLREIGPGGSSDCSLTLILSRTNRGYAAAVNLGLQVLRARSDVAGYWILNPDTVVGADSASLFHAAVTSGQADLISSRLLDYNRPDTILADGGRLNRATGVCTSLNGGRSASQTELPDPSEIDYLSGASLVATRELVERIGFMPEDYFLYFEEVDWCFRARSARIALLGKPLVFHRGGVTINADAIEGRESPLSLFLKHRNRIRFVRRHLPASVGTALVWTIAKAAQVWLVERDPIGAKALLAGAFGWAPPPAVAARLDAIGPQAWD